jgi:SNF2 family DNA or RNA helicase
MSSTILKKEKSFSIDQLHGYQHKMVNQILENPRCALFCEMGLGKSVATLTAVTQLLDTFEAAKVLIIAPLRVAKHTWPNEIEKWGHTKHLTYEVICGTAEGRQKKLKTDVDIHIINREMVVWLVEELFNEWPYDVVVIDESSSFKSPSSKRFKALRKVHRFFDRLIELTGTPASNGLLGLWSQIYLLDHGRRLGKTFTSYTNQFFISGYRGFRWTAREEAPQIIQERLKSLCLSLSAKDYLKMPERIDNVVEVELPPQLRSQYRKLEWQFLVKLEENTVEAVNAAVLSGKLLQFCNGAMYIGDPYLREKGKSSFEEIHKLKLDALEEVIEEAAGQPVMIAHNYISDRDRIKERFPHAEHITDHGAIDRWNKKQIPLLLAHPGSAGHGLNLQEGGNIIVWFGLNWSLELYMQLNARLHRQGQKKPVFVHHLVVKDSVDETVLQALSQKRRTQKGLLDALKRDIGRRV